MRRRKNLKKPVKKPIAKVEPARTTKPEKTTCSKPEPEPEDTTTSSAESDQNMQEEKECSTSESEDIETSPSPEPTVPARAMRRPTRMTLLPPAGRPARMTLLPPVGRPARMKLIPTARVLPALRRSGSDSPHAGPSSTHSEQPTTSSAPTPRARMPIRTCQHEDLPRAVPRTRVLLTPERSSSPRMPLGRVLRTPERDIAGPPGGSFSRASSKKTKRMRAAIRRQMRLIQTKKDSSPSDTTSSGLESDGLDSSGGNSGDESSAGEPPSTPKKIRSVS